MNYELIIKKWLAGEMKWHFETLEQVQEFIMLSMEGDTDDAFEYTIRVVKNPEEGEE